MTWYKRILYMFCTTCRPNRSRTVRYAFSLTLSAFVILGALTISSTNSTIIEIVPSNTNVKAGEMVKLSVYVSASKPVNAVDIKVAIPESQLRVTGIDTGQSVITLWTEDPYYDNGIAHFSGGTFRRGFIGRHLIGTINAEARTTGLAYVNVTDSLLLSGDGTGNEVAVTETEKESIKLYIASADGTFSDPLGTNAGALSGTAEISIITDIDGDGVVTLNDISRFMSAWQSKSTIFDFNGDGKMTFRDFAIILAHSFLR